MNRAIYIATGEPESGKSIITLGLMRILLGRTKKVGYFRPIIDDVKRGGKDQGSHKRLLLVMKHANPQKVKAENQEYCGQGCR